LRIENGELRIRDNSENSKNSENSGSDKESRIENEEQKVRGNRERGNNENPENPKNPEPPENPKVAARINTIRLKLIDELSRIILDLKPRFPELAQNLERVRDNVPVKQDNNVSAKNLTEFFNAIRQIINNPEIINKPETQEAVRNLVNDAIKILQPSSSPETPPENKLILALLKNDFASANIAIRNIVEQNLQQQTQTPSPPMRTYQPVQPQPAPIAPPVPPVPPVLQPAPQPVSQPQPLPAPVAPPAPPVLQPASHPVPQAQPLPAPVAPPAPPTPQPAPQPITLPSQIPLPQLVAQPVPQHTFQTFQTILSVLQEIKTLGVPQELQNAPLKELEAIALQKVGIEVPKNLVKNISETFSEKPIFATASIKIENPARIESPASIEITPPAKQQSAPAPAPAPAPAFEIPLPKNFVQNFTQTFPQTLPSPQKSSPQNVQKQEIAFSLYREAKPILQAWPASVQIPKEERDFWIKTELPLTPQILNLREAILSFGKLPENPAVVKLFAEGMHEMSLLAENGKPITKEQTNLLWRFVETQTPQQTSMQTPMQIPQQILPQIPLQVTHSLLKYQPAGNYEGELFKSLPEVVKKEILRELPAEKAWQPELLQKAIEKIKPGEEFRQILQNFKEQIQWTRIDQDTRQPQDRENVFYFMHNSELQKGRLKVKDERKGGGKRQSGSSISFSIKTHTKTLGDVNADLTLSKNVLSIRLQDSVGTAGKAVEEERGMLAKELADIGISLGELLYGRTPKTRNLPIARVKEESGGLDVRA
jgi:hypothetical protein